MKWPSKLSRNLKDKIGPLNKKLNTSKSQQEKDSLKKLIKQAKKLLEQNQKTAPKEIVKAHELICTYFIGEARTQWDKVVQEMHNNDPWVAVDGSLHKGPCERDWDSFLDCIELHKLTIFSCDAAKLQRYYMQQHIWKPQRVTVRAFVACLAEKVSDILATCRPDSQMSSLLAKMPLSRQHNFDPDTFFCVHQIFLFSTLGTYVEFLCKF